MQRTGIKITLKSPLLLTSNTGDPNMIETYEYIPARSLRGLFARQYIKKHGLKDAHRDKRFYNWFLRGALRFTDAFILSDDKINIPIPLSIQQVKRGKDTFDLSLVDDDFDKETKPLEGFGYIDGERIHKGPIKKNFNFHHAREREKGVSKEGMIFNYESLQPEQCFGAFIEGEEKDIEEFLKDFSDGIYYLGRSRNNQYGQVYIEFNAKLTSIPQPPDLKPGELSLSLLSDTIVYNEWGFPVTDIRVIEEITGCRMKRSFIKTSDIESFISVWRLKTPSEISFRAGSIFLIDVPDEETLNSLLELQQKGLGERIEEGFGRFILMELKAEKIILQEEAPKKEGKPSENPPEVVKDLITKILKEHILNLIKAIAVYKAKDVQNHPTPSLLGRLLLILRDSKGHEEFRENLKKLRKTARDKLEDSRIDNRSLYEFLVETDLLEIPEINNLKTRNDFKEIVRYSSNPLDDALFEVTLSREYLETFLSILLKEAKKR